MVSLKFQGCLAQCEGSSLVLAIQAPSISELNIGIHGLGTAVHAVQGQGSEASNVLCKSLIMMRCEDGVIREELRLVGVHGGE